MQENKKKVKETKDQIPNDNLLIYIPYSLDINMS